MRDFLGSAPAFKGLDIHPFGDLADAFSSSESQLHSRQDLADIELDETLKKKILEKRSGEGLGAVADDLKLWAYAVKHSVTVNHPMGTLPFSRSGEEEGVLDSELRVKGVQGVRVVDASVFVSFLFGFYVVCICVDDIWLTNTLSSFLFVQPSVAACHIQAVVYTVAERAADLIKAQYGL